MTRFWEGRRYADRQEAGRLLSEMLSPFRSANPVVLAIPNGGVAVALPIAWALQCPLRLMVVRKLQIPDQPEAGFGSVASDGSLLLNEPLVRSLGLTEKVISAQKEKALKTIQERLVRYGDSAQFPELKSKTAILVDDGLASGLTMEAAVRIVKKHGPAAVIVAVPTSSMAAFHRISPIVDKVICPEVSRLPIFAVADAYKVWRDLDDDEVIEMIRRQAAPPD